MWGLLCFLVILVLPALLHRHRRHPVIRPVHHARQGRDRVVHLVLSVRNDRTGHSAPFARQVRAVLPALFAHHDPAAQPVRSVRLLRRRKNPAAVPADCTNARRTAEDNAKINFRIQLWACGPKFADYQCVQNRGWSTAPITN